RPLEDAQLRVGGTALVIGAGIAGLAAAETIAGFGFEVILVEREPQLGGTVARLAPAPGGETGEIVAEKIRAVTGHPRIQVLTRTRIRAVEGFLGNFRVTLDSEGATSEALASTIVVATGLRESPKERAMERLALSPDPAVLSQAELEQRLGGDFGGEPGGVVIVNCPDAEEIPPCGTCRIGCGVALKNARRLVERFPKTTVHVLVRELMTPGLEERAGSGPLHPRIKILRYGGERLPVIRRERGRFKVTVRDDPLDAEVDLRADLLVLTLPLAGDPENEALGRILKITLGSGGFFQEAHVKLRPVETMVDGIYLAGAARGPGWVADAIQGGMAAGFKAAVPMRKGVTQREGTYAVVDHEGCDGCGLCDRVCAFGAVLLEKKKDANIVPALCTGCGVCAADCPRDVIDMNAFEDRQILAQIDAALEHEPQRKILAFLCNWCGYVAADTAGAGRIQYHPAVRAVRVLCSGRVDRSFVIHALHKGAGAVLIAGCRPGDCHYVDGNRRSARRLEKLRWWLEKNGIPPTALREVWLASTEGRRFAEIVNEMAEGLGAEQSAAWRERASRLLAPASAARRTKLSSPAASSPGADDRAETP
ncbi:MAG: hydrogenase iron-sulfur subunit, partial [Deltaproteobacteria bacterium]|nr:hydrogenase iron-sulfur subunit [Deltaproteobacteria bacterium]